MKRSTSGRGTATHGVFGLHTPGHSWLHRAPVVAKLTGVVVASLVPLIARSPWVTAGLLVVVAALLASTRIPPRRAFAIAPVLLLLLGALVIYQLLLGHSDRAVVVPGNVLVCLFASRVLVLTSPGPDLLDALVTILRPVRLVGVDSERVALAIALMIRSIPHLLTAMSQVQDAARARGLERNPLARVAPLVVLAIKHAQDTGDALIARGLGERADAPRPGADPQAPAT